LPPLVLHALSRGSARALKRWIAIRPRNALTVLDTHDGIGVIDAGPGAGLPGLLSEEEMAAVFARAAEATGGHSTLASVTPTWASMPHQINATFFSVLGGDVRRMLLARAVQVFVPGEPQFYYVGLLGGLDDRDRFAATGQGHEGRARSGARDAGGARPARPGAPPPTSRVRRRVLVVAAGRGLARTRLAIGGDGDGARARGAPARAVRRSRVHDHPRRRGGAARRVISRGVAGVAAEDGSRSATSHVLAAPWHM
jgi:hypothetical protein